VLLGTLIILAFEAELGAEIFNRCSRSLKCFLPRIERALQAVEFLAFELRLRERVPCAGIVRNDGDNAPAQFNDCRFVFRVLSFLQLVSQLLKLRNLSGGESAGSQQNKNGDNERSQRGPRSWPSRREGSSIFGRLQRLASAQEELAAGTELEYFAPAAVRLARVAAAAPMPNEPVTPICPMLARHELNQIKLNLYGVSLFR